MFVTDSIKRKLVSIVAVGDEDCVWAHFVVWKVDSETCLTTEFSLLRRPCFRKLESNKICLMKVQKM
jgi:hypothetical protein